jgi:hypothetical protein
MELLSCCFVSKPWERDSGVGSNRERESAQAAATAIQEGLAFGQEPVQLWSSAIYKKAQGLVDAKSGQERGDEKSEW